MTSDLSLDCRICSRRSLSDTQPSVLAPALIRGPDRLSLEMWSRLTLPRLLPSVAHRSTNQPATDALHGIWAPCIQLARVVPRLFHCLYHLGLVGDRGGGVSRACLRLAKELQAFVGGHRCHLRCDEICTWGKQHCIVCSIILRPADEFRRSLCLMLEVVIAIQNERPTTEYQVGLMAIDSVQFNITWINFNLHQIGAPSSSSRNPLRDHHPSRHYGRRGSKCCRLPQAHPGSLPRMWRPLVNLTGTVIMLLNGHPNPAFKCSVCPRHERGLQHRVDLFHTHPVLLSVFVCLVGITPLPADPKRSRQISKNFLTYKFRNDFGPLFRRHRAQT